jgi:glycine oxidase
MEDVLIVGGGVIGLSLAWELARQGRAVQVIDRGELGREASWAGAGILPPAAFKADDHPAEQLRGLACRLHGEWAERLARETGLDNGYRRCGGLYLARTAGERAALAAWAALLREDGVAMESLTADAVGQLEPGLAPGAGTTAVLAPGEAQLRNPWHLQALVAACQRAGVRLAPQTPAEELVVRDGELAEVHTPRGVLRARQYCFTSGAWTGELLRRAGQSLAIVPIRGQIVLFRCSQPPLRRIVNEGSRYLVPREDGRVLAGSTEEDVGFDKRTTDEAIADLIAFARGLVPALAAAQIERIWAGLRPGSLDGMPYLGRLPGLVNAYVAAGHFRTGLYLSPATAVVMCQLMRGEPTEIDLSPFRVGR